MSCLGFKGDTSEWRGEKKKEVKNVEKIRFVAATMMLLVLVGGVFSASVSAEPKKNQKNKDGSGEVEPEVLNEWTAYISPTSDSLSVDDIHTYYAWIDVTGGPILTPHTWWVEWRWDPQKLSLQSKDAYVINGGADISWDINDPAGGKVRAKFFDRADLDGEVTYKTEVDLKALESGNTVIWAYYYKDTDDDGIPVQFDTKSISVTIN
jgi:hypothetical protein